MSGDASLTIPCACNWLSCQLRVTLMEEDGTGSVELIVPRRTLLERIRKAWRYVIGGEPPVAEVCLTKEQVHQLKQVLVGNEYIDWKREYTAQRDRELARLPESRL